KATYLPSALIVGQRPPTGSPASGGVSALDARRTDAISDALTGGTRTTRASAGRRARLPTRKEPVAVDRSIDEHPRKSNQVRDGDVHRGCATYVPRVMGSPRRQVTASKRDRRSEGIARRRIGPKTVTADRSCRCAGGCYFCLLVPERAA